MLRTIASAGALAGFFWLSAAAADDPGATATDSPTTDASGLQQTVITATRTPQPLARTGDSLSVLSGDELATRQTLVVSDALQTLPGVSLARNGGIGQTTSLYIRGADSGESLLLVDGVRINDPSAPDGAAVLSDLLVDDIDRIEVLRGPQSTLYGSDAIGGVVNVITRRGGDAPLHANLDAEGGSYGTYRLNANANGTAGPLDYGAGVNYYDSRGISAADSALGNSEPDGYRNFNLNLNARAHLSEAISLDLRGFYVRSRTDIDGYPPPDYLFQDTPEFGRDWLRAGYAAFNGSWFGGAVQQRVAMVGSDSDRRFYGSFTPSSADPDVSVFAPSENFYAQGGATRFEYQGIQQLGADNQITYGAESELTTLHTDSLPDYGAGPTTGRDRVTGYYGQWQTTLAQALTLTGGVRYDRDQQFGGHTSVKLAGAWQLMQGATVLRANYGNGFKAPTLYQLFSPYSNPDATLAPESAHGWEAGIDQQLLPGTQLIGSATYFQRGEHNLIDFIDCPYGVPATGACVARAAVGGYYANIDRAFVRGWELGVTGAIAPGVSAWGNYTNLAAHDELDGLQLARRPHITANAGTSFSAAGSSLGADITYLGRRYDDAANAVPLSSDTLVNVFASYALTTALTFTTRIENAFDHRTEPTAGYGALGRAYYAGLRAVL